MYYFCEAFIFNPFDAVGAKHRQGKIDPNSVKSVSNTFEDSRSAQNAFQRAKRALMKCGVNGYDLPSNKYQQWKRMELTFEQ